jgi:hypothetical protein
MNNPRVKVILVDTGFATKFVEGFTRGVEGIKSGTRAVAINLPRNLAHSVEDALGETLVGKKVSKFYRQRAMKTKPIKKSLKELRGRYRELKVNGPNKIVVWANDPQIRAMQEKAYYEPQWRINGLQRMRNSTKLRLSSEIRVASKKAALRDFAITTGVLGAGYGLQKQRRDKKEV